MFENHLAVLSPKSKKSVFLLSNNEFFFECDYFNLLIYKVIDFFNNIFIKMKSKKIDT